MFDLLAAYDTRFLALDKLHLSATSAAMVLCPELLFTQDVGELTDWLSATKDRLDAVKCSAATTGAAQTLEIFQSFFKPEDDGEDPTAVFKAGKLDAVTEEIKAKANPAAPGIVSRLQL